MAGIADYVLIGFVLLILVDVVLMSMYCRLQERIEKYKVNKKNNNKETETIPSDSPLETQSAVKKLYHFLEGYAGGLARYNLLLVGRLPSHGFRKFLYKYIFRLQLSKKTIIYGGCEIRSPWNIKIGSSTIGCGCLLDGRNHIQIGDDVVFGSYVHIWTAEHDLNDPYFRTLEHNKQPVIINNRAWICSDSTILPGVHIGEGAVVAARACVTKDCDAFTVYAGIPAKKIADRNKDLKYHLSGVPSYRFY